ncbi:MAG: BspA family leucine-rich repeat surface protein [Muribaculaceae bacterium]|nr:BspA family leucine-rich repeat surface protein [Muribaculaceae bacterium]
MEKSRLFTRCMGRWLMALLLVMLTSLAARAAETYACYTPTDSTLTFYCDNYRSSRTGTTYSMNVGPQMPGWQFDDLHSKITKVVFNSSFASATPVSTYNWFSGMYKVKSITGIQYLNTSNVRNMAGMFMQCEILQSIDLSHFNTALVEDMAYMFGYCPELRAIDLSTFNTANVTNMRYMFQNCRSLTTLNLSTFNTANVTNMEDMFYNCSSMTTIYVGSGWNTAAVTTSGNMFSNCFKLKGCRGTAYNTSHVDKTYARIDGGTANPGYLSDPNLKAYACLTDNNTKLTFYYDTQMSTRSGTTYLLNEGTNTPGWNTSYNLDRISKVAFDPSFADFRPTSTYKWFSGMSRLDTFTGLSYLNTSEVTNMGYMFNGCSDVDLMTIDLSTFNTAKVTNMTSMFNGCSHLVIIYADSGWKTTAVTSSSNMFTGCTSLVGGKGTTYNANYVDKTYARLDGGSSNPGYLTSLDPVAYASYSPSAFRLIFYYNNHRALNTSTTYDVYLNASTPSWYGLDFVEEVRYVLFDNSFADARPKSTAYWFASMEHLANVSGLQNLNTSQVTNMESMFYDCRILKDLDLSNFNTANVTNMAGMFAYCNDLTALDLSHFNTAKVTDMEGMFINCIGLTALDLSNFNTAKVTDMSGMFRYCTGLTSLDLGGFNTGNVTDMAGMFRYCTGLRSLNLSNFNTGNVTNMSGMFQECSNLVTIDVSSQWTTDAVTTDEHSTNMFSGCTSLVGGQGTTYDENHVDKAYAHIDGGPSNPGYLTDPDAPVPYACYTSDNRTLTFYYDNQRSSRPGTTFSLPSGNYTYPDWGRVNIKHVVFDPSFAAARPTSTHQWFGDYLSIESITGLEYLNTSEVTDMSFMFSGCYAMTSLDVSHFNTSNVTNMASMFYGCSDLESLDLSNFNTANVTDMNCMFLGCSGLTSLDLSSFNTAKVTDMNHMFNDCGAASIDLSSFNTSSVTDMSSMFSGCSVDSLDLSSFDTRNVTTMFEMFNYCYNLTSLDLSSFNTENLEDMSYMFAGCRGLTELNLSSFNTTKVGSFFCTFRNCESLETLDLGSFNTENLVSMYSMFEGCSSLKNLNLSSFNTANLTDMSEMFNGCSSLTSLDLSSFNTANVTTMSYMFNRCESLATIYVGEGWSTSAVEHSSDMFWNCPSLVGGMGTTYDENHVDAEYAHIDGGPSNPGYFTGLSTDPEAYAVYTEDNKTLTFYYDNQRRFRPGTTYGLNLGSDGMEWLEIRYLFTQVVFDPSFADARPTTTRQWFEGMVNVRSFIGMEYLNTDSVTDMTYMFDACRSLLSLDLSHFNTSKVTTMEGMFAGCRALTSLDLSSFNTDNVTTMEGMFLYCMGLKSVDLSGFTNARMRRTSNMFQGCYALTTIYADSGWSLPANNYSFAMFSDCTSLVGGKGTTFDENHTNAEYAHIDGGPSNPGYFTEKLHTGDVNGDGAVNITDVTYLNNLLSKGDPSVSDYPSGDIDGNGVINITDVTMLINKAMMAR